MTTTRDVTLVAARHGIGAAADHYGWSRTAIANLLEQQGIRPGPVILRTRCRCDRCTSWPQLAACRGKDTDLWFPKINPDATGHTAWDEPRAICDTCPVRQECEDHATQHGHVDAGMWGARTPDELRRIRRKIRHHQERTS